MALDLLRASGVTLAEWIRSGRVSSRQVIDTHIARAIAVNPTLNAIVADRYADARREADEADQRLRDAPKDELPPFLGVPCTVKECFGLTGMPQSSGLVARKNVRAFDDATVVARVRAAGAIPIGVTNLSELCMWMESFNRVYGRTNNPYDPSRIVGGSSGGEGAIVASGSSPFGIASDIGGSIRMPAFFNGVFGHKPTAGLIPNTGQYPISEGDALGFLSTGPITRHAEDLEPLVRVMAGPDGEDSRCQVMPLHSVSEVDVGKLQVIVVESDGRIPVSRELRAAQARAATHLESLGATVRPARFAGLRHALEIWAAMLQDAQQTSYVELLGNGADISLKKEFVRWAFRRSPFTLPSLGLSAIEHMTASMVERSEQMRALGAELRHELVEAIGPQGVMLYPSYPTVAPRHHTPLLLPVLWTYTAILNVMELPVTQVPLGLNKRGLPLGVQVATVHGNDHVSIAVACELERAFGGWVYPSGLSELAQTA